MITREQARDLAQAWLDGRRDGLARRRVRDVVAWDEITCRRPLVCNLMDRIQKCWIVYLEIDGPPACRASEIVVVARSDGRILHAGSANDEG